jgi:hypothetical protein
LIYPSFGCSGGYVAQERDYAVETNNLLSQHYLSTGSSTDRTNTDLFFTSQFAVAGFTSPFLGDGHPVDLLECCDQFTLTKYYGQVYSVGQAYQWPAARLGGVQSPNLETYLIGFNLSSFHDAANVNIKITAPSGAINTTFCSSSPCAVGLDVRQGDHWMAIQYLSAGATPLSTGPPVLIQVTP